VSNLVRVWTREMLLLWHLWSKYTDFDVVQQFNFNVSLKGPQGYLIWILVSECNDFEEVTSRVW